MDIKHFSYFVTIVQCGCNLSAAAKKLHISQSALSKIVLTFEQEENVQLFHRRAGRLFGLTPAGELFYAGSGDISGRYELMLRQIRQVAGQCRGRVVVGIPPLVLSVIFTTVVREFKRQYPGVELQIAEAGAEALQRQLARGEIDFAVLLSPTGLDPAAFCEHLLLRDELTAFVSAQNPLARKEAVEWADLDGVNLAIFNDSFSIHRLLTERFRELGVNPVVALTSASWDFLLEAVIDSDFVTVLPAPIAGYMNAEKVRSVPFSQPVAWEVALAERRAQGADNAGQAFRDYVLDSFGSA